MRIFQLEETGERLIELCLSASSDTGLVALVARLLMKTKRVDLLGTLTLVDIFNGLV